MTCISQDTGIVFEVELTNTTGLTFIVDVLTGVTMFFMGNLRTFLSVA